MRKPRANIRLSHEAYAMLDDMARKPGVHKCSIMEAAFWAYLDSHQGAGADKTILKRLDSIDLRLNAVERDAALVVETLGQFILYWLTRTDPLPDGERDAAHRLGQKRFDYFIEQVARKLGADEGLSRRFTPDKGAIENDVDKPERPD
jgi:hypothetical protein